jgi:hypothetical protein
MITYAEIAQLQHPNTEDFLRLFESACRRENVSPIRQWREFVRLMEESDQMQNLSDVTIALAVMDAFLVPHLAQ